MNATTRTLSLQGQAVLPFGFALEVPLELTGAFNRPHSDQPSVTQALRVSWFYRFVHPSSLNLGNYTIA